jgi:hypothetical protein
MQTAVSIVALALSALSLGWQGATWLLTGGRVKVELRVGAMHQSGSGLIHTSVANWAHAWSDHEAEQGYRHPVIVVQVRNVGRLPITVTEWSVMVQPSNTAFRPLADSIGPAMPYRMEPGTEETWALELAAVESLVGASAETFKITDPIHVRGRVGLGTGRVVIAPERLRMK